MKKSLLVMVFTLLVLSAAALAAPRQADARQALPTPPPAGVRLLANASALVDSAQRLLVAETAPDSHKSLLYLLDPANLSQKTAFAEVTHRVGYPPRGQVSPDGKWISILAVPPGASETAARTDGGEVWLLAADGSSAQRLTASASQLAGWSPDGSWLAYARLAPIANPPQPQIPFRTEVYRARPDGQETALIFADAENYAVRPLGWLPDGSYLAALLDMDGVWRLAAFSSGSQVRAWDLPGFDLVRCMALSPTGEQVLVEAMRGGEDVLFVLDLTGGQLQTQPQLAAAPMPPGQPVSPLQAVWSARGHLWIVRQDAGLPRPAVTGPNPPPDAPRLDLPAGESLLPESWSPDENWFLYRRYPRIYSEIYLQPRGRDTLTALRPDQPSSWLALIGWIPAGGSR